MSRFAAAAVFVAAFGLSLLRLPASLALDTVWAEDGDPFLTDTQSEPLLASVLRPYAGYAHVLPRVIAWLVDLLPATTAAAGFAVAAAGVQAAAALTGYVVVRAHRREPYVAVFVAVAVAMVPVGPEALLNVANIQWFLLFGGTAAQLWTPVTAFGRLAQLAMGLSLVLSCPFGLLAVGLGVIRAVVRRARWDVTATGVLLLGAGVQLWVIAGAGSGRMRPTFIADAMVNGYLRRVIADGVLGIGRFSGSAFEPDVGAGVVLLISLAVLLLALARQHQSSKAVPAVAFMVLSFIAYLVPVVLSANPTTDPGFGGRYYVAPALLWIVALALALPTPPVALSGRWVVGCVMTAVAVVASFGWLTSRDIAQSMRRDAPRWSTELSMARDRCSVLPPSATAEVPIAPRGWVASLNCQSLTDEAGR